jgi:hypothetical protein
MMTADGFFWIEVVMLASSWGEVSMSTTPDAEITTVRPNQASLMTHPALGVAFEALVAVGCSFKIHLTKRNARWRAHADRSPARLSSEPGNAAKQIPPGSIAVNAGLPSTFLHRRNLSRLTERFSSGGYGIQLCPPGGLTGAILARSAGR